MNKESELAFNDCIDYVHKTEAALYRGQAYMAQRSSHKAIEAMKEAIEIMEGIELVANREVERIRNDAERAQGIDVEELEIPAYLLRQGG